MEGREVLIRLLNEGDELAMAGQIKSAISKYTEGIHLISDFKNSSDIAIHFYVARGDCHFHYSEFLFAENDYIDALNCKGGKDNAYLYIELGKIYFNKKQKTDCLQTLAIAYDLGGMSIFEEEDEKYLKIIEYFINKSEENKCNVYDILENEDLSNFLVPYWEEKENSRVKEKIKIDKRPGTTWSLLDDED